VRRRGWREAERVVELLRIEWAQTPPAGGRHLGESVASGGRLVRCAARLGDVLAHADRAAAERVFEGGRVDDLEQSSGMAERGTRVGLETRDLRSFVKGELAEMQDACQVAHHDRQGTPIGKGSLGVAGRG
jgi:hypothetical protein